MVVVTSMEILVSVLRVLVPPAGDNRVRVSSSGKGVLRVHSPWGVENGAGIGSGFSPSQELHAGIKRQSHFVARRRLVSTLEIEWTAFCFD